MGYQTTGRPGAGWSHPAWGAWIEIADQSITQGDEESRTPHGVRGLKYPKLEKSARNQQSHPAWGAWIEIHQMT